MTWALAPLNKGVFAQAKALRGSYGSAAPFPHGVLEPLCDPAFLRRVRAEVLDQDLHAKETDLYRLRQSIDYSNFDELLAKHPKMRSKVANILALRDALYSSEFRQLMSDVTGCGPLNTKVDLAASLYTNGSHLLLHDDVIGSRRIAFILYLTLTEDDEGGEAWTAADGGCLQLFPADPQNPAFPASVSGANILPLFNRFAFFTVEAGRSFHAVQEVFALEKERLSIQGWFHADKVPAPAVAPLKQLKRCAEAFIDRVRPCNIVPSISADGEIELSERVVRELSQLGLHPMYFDAANLAQLAAEFGESGVVRLGNLLMPVLVDPLLEHLRAADVADGLGLGQPAPPSETAGVDALWSLRGPAHIRRHLELADELPDDDEDEEEDSIQDAGGSATAGGGGGDIKAKKRARKEAAAARAAAAAARRSRRELVMMLGCIRDRLVASDAFAAFVSAIISSKWRGALTGRYVAARRFRPGLDYTLATVPHDAPIVELTYTLCNGVPLDDAEGEGSAEQQEDEEEPTVLEEGEEDDELGFWESCEVGGFDSYVRAEADTTAGTVMSACPDADAVRNLPCESNCLSIVMRNPDTMHFVKYVQAAAPSSRLDVYAVFVGDPEGNASEVVTRKGSSSGKKPQKKLPK